MPHPDWLLVVAQGQGYTIEANSPALASPVLHVFPVMLVREIVAAELIVVGDFIRLGAYGRQGRLWRTKRLSSDGVEVTSVSAGAICGLGWNAAHDQWVDFTVDPVTGAHTGGSD